MGLDCVDYILVDSYVVPWIDKPYYREQLVHLPGCYQVNDSRIKVAEWSPTRTYATCRKMQLSAVLSIRV